MNAKLENDQIKLLTPTAEYEQQAEYLIAQADSVDTDESFRFAGFGGLDMYKGRYSEWLNVRSDVSQGKNLPQGYVKATTLFAVRKSDNKVVGIVDVRHSLSDYLSKYGGHIGYTVLPEERRKGYGKQILQLALQFCRAIGIENVLLICADHNQASYKTIERCGAVLENKIFDPSDNVWERRYWIKPNATETLQ